MPIYETVEYNPAKDLLIVRNSKPEDNTGHTLLIERGWTEIPPAEVADILPPTPGPPKDFHWLSRRRGSSASESSAQSNDTPHQDERVDDSAHSNNHKRVYKRAPAVIALHAA